MAGSNPELIESLSDRELEVIHLLSQAFPNKKIARALGLSPDTVKWREHNPLQAEAGYIDARP
jgi:LuxR family maltose regulon positive regulatory protein